MVSLLLSEEKVTYILICQMWVSATVKKKIEKRKKGNGLTHKLPLSHKIQFSFTTQEECNLTF